MTRKDYVLIAAAIKSQLGFVPHERDLTIEAVAKAIAAALAQDNPRFDRERFMKACGF